MIYRNRNVNANLRRIPLESIQNKIVTGLGASTRLQNDENKCSTSLDVNTSSTSQKLNTDFIQSIVD